MKKVAFEHRSWFANMGLVFRLCYHNFVPLLLACLFVGLPAFALDYRGWVSAGRPSLDFWEGSGRSFSTTWWLDLLEMPIRQGVCLFLVARCFEGVRIQKRDGVAHVLYCLPSLFMFSVIGALSLLIAMIPACFLGLGGLRWIAVIVGLFPMIWIFTGLSLGPALIVVERVGPISAMGHGFMLAHRRRTYLISFLGLLYLPAILSFSLEMLFPVSNWRGLAGSQTDHGSALSLAWRELMRTLLDLPATIAPAVLYFQFTVRQGHMPASELARLVDRIGDRNQA